jgi:hypothetical protein
MNLTTPIAVATAAGLLATSAGSLAATAPPAEPAPPPAPEAFEACLPTNFGPGPDVTTEELSIPTPEGEIRLVRERGATYEGELRSEDPRFRGTHYFSGENDIYTFPDGREIAFTYYHHRFETADGAWQGSAGPIFSDDDYGEDLALFGEGAYEGLMAIATWLSVFAEDPDLQSTDPACTMQFTGCVVGVFEPPEGRTLEEP